MFFPCGYVIIHIVYNLCMCVYIHIYIHKCVYIYIYIYIHIRGVDRPGAVWSIRVSESKANTLASTQTNKRYATSQQFDSSGLHRAHARLEHVPACALDSCQARERTGSPSSVMPVPVLRQSRQSSAISPIRGRVFQHIARGSAGLRDLRGMRDFWGPCGA